MGNCFHVFFTLAEKTAQSARLLSPRPERLFPVVSILNEIGFQWD